MSGLLRFPLATLASASIVVALAAPSYAVLAVPEQAPQTAAKTAAHPQPRAATTRQVQPRRAVTVLRRMTLPQKVGQLFMVGTPATSASSPTLAAITNRHVGNVMLTGRSFGGTKTPAAVAAAMQARATWEATRSVGLLVATDQEGGLVQVLNGPGISDMPTALQQGKWTLSRLRTAAGRWGHQLRTAGVNMNLAPVLDVVPSAAAAANNPPIGAFDREFGFTPRVVARHGRAFMNGMLASGVVTAVKHFPGLGRVHANTDTSTGVTDTVTRRHDPYFRPFHVAIGAGTPFVMMSTAYYSRLDPRNPAAFSRFIIGTILRGDLGFRGAVISDDLGGAAQVSPWSPGRRALKFLRAGGTMVLNVRPDVLPAMYDAVLARARHNNEFRARVNADVLKVLQIKQSRGLL